MLWGRDVCEGAVAGLFDWLLLGAPAEWDAQDDFSGVFLFGAGQQSRRAVQKKPLRR
jgi:hypothetical protein